MKTVSKIEDIRKELNKARMDGLRIGFVPTMGFLHEGHLSLVRKCRDENDIVVVSIFVNPAQFGAGEDLDSYPSDIKRDTALLEAAGTNILFLPEREEIYPEGFSTNISVAGVSDGLCGRSRPGHFDGVCTVVTKLLNIVQPERAYFGEKDYQQLQVIKRLARDLNIPSEIIGGSIIREDDGLAMSSRNVYLTPEQRESALSLNRSFKVVQDALKEGVEDVSELRADVEEFINSHEYARIDYIEFVDPEFLRPVRKIEGDFLMALAVYVGKARLIDNNYFEVQK
ncbi:pantoate--beta-alanine ligase [Limisalsivibrio acetivorans]|uniref:pantoate--beta-alanine ligase n=1 Tax=Limisalsivibrio acetivorans TaxID=1304888 RepID=UPI0003B2E92F|nr:pantoate--beta-alanine ligase [Limisalsivibrio acetivorans]